MQLTVSPGLPRVRPVRSTGCCRWMVLSSFQQRDPDVVRALRNDAKENVPELPECSIMTARSVDLSYELSCDGLEIRFARCIINSSS